MMPGEWDWMKLGQDVSGMPTDDVSAQLMLKRKLAMADALRNQEAPQGQMVSGHYVAPSWTQNLANVASKLIGAQQENAAIKGYQDYLGQQRTKRQTAMSALAKALEPQAETTQGTYDIQVPNGKTPTATDNLGGMQPYESSMKTIQVPMTTTTGYRKPTSNEIYNAVSAYANATNNPDLGEKLLFSQAEKGLTPDTYDIHNIGDVGYVINKRTGLPTGYKLAGEKKVDYGTAADSTARALFGRDYKDLSQPEQKRVVDYNNQFRLGNLIVAQGNLGVNQKNAAFNTGDMSTNTQQSGGKTTTLAEIQDYAKKHGISFEQSKQHAIDLGYSF